MAGWIGLLGSVRGVAEAGLIASHLSETEARSEDLVKVQTFLENKIVVQNLVDYGVSPEEAKAKVETMSTQDLHRLASLTDRAAVGTDSGLGDPHWDLGPHHPHPCDLADDAQGSHGSLI